VCHLVHDMYTMTPLHRYTCTLLHLYTMTPVHCVSFSSCDGLCICRTNLKSIIEIYKYVSCI